MTPMYTRRPPTSIVTMTFSAQYETEYNGIVTPTVFYLLTTKTMSHHQLEDPYET
jgi:hypothetical protein